jgi:hypothetical protein
MAWNVETTFKHAGFRSFATFRVAWTIGCVLMWKPWRFVIGVERWRGGFGFFIGPLAAGCGPIDES